MVNTIGNPLTWATRGAAAAGAHAAAATATVGGEGIAAEPRVQSLDTQDLREALRLGYKDFTAARTDVMTLCVVYPLIGLALAALSVQSHMLHLLFPLVAGFALIAPAGAVIFYQISRRREAGEDAGWTTGLKIVQAPSFGAVVAMGLFQMGIFALWMMAAHMVYALTLGTGTPETPGAFLSAVFTTSAGWAMIVIGTGVGFLFALVVLATALFSYPMLIDRKVGLPVAVTTSARVFAENPRVIAQWGLIVTAALVAGSVPLLVGLVIVLPLLGHATWHLYRRAIRF